MEPMLWSGLVAQDLSSSICHLSPYLHRQATPFIYSERQGERALRHTVAGDVSLRQWGMFGFAFLRRNARITENRAKRSVFLPIFRTAASLDRSILILENAAATSRTFLRSESKQGLDLICHRYTVDAISFRRQILGPTWNTGHRNGRTDLTGTRIATGRSMQSPPQKWP
jgi:hypothetical protein